MFNNSLSENQQLEINEELDRLLVDPCWSDYIFFSEDYLYKNGNINYEKFFDKIEEYENDLFPEYKNSKRLK